MKEQLKQLSPEQKRQLHEHLKVAQQLRESHFINDAGELCFRGTTQQDVLENANIGAPITLEGRDGTPVRLGHEGLFSRMRMANNPNAPHDAAQAAGELADICEVLLDTVPKSKRYETLADTRKYRELAEEHETRTAGGPPYFPEATKQEAQAPQTKALTPST